MQASRRFCLYASVVLAALAAPDSRTRAEALKITSTPSGATVEINGVVVGTTPYRVEYPGGYFHKPHAVFAARLEHALVARISMSGFASQQITLAEGPLEWLSVTGKRAGKYWLLKSDHFEVKLEAVPSTVATAPSPRESEQTAVRQLIATDRKLRIYVVDSESWEVRGNSWSQHDSSAEAKIDSQEAKATASASSSGGSYVAGGARPQTVEIIKTFNERCPQVTVTSNATVADFAIRLEHEGGKGYARRKDKIAVFDRAGDVIFSDSTRSVGSAVKDACAAIQQHQPAHSP